MTDHLQRRKTTLGLSPQEEDLAQEIVRQLDDVHSLGAFRRIVSREGLGEAIAYRLLLETFEQERHIQGPLGAYFIGMCKQVAREQGIDLGFVSPPRA